MNFFPDPQGHGSFRPAWNTRGRRGSASHVSRRFTTASRHSPARRRSAARALSRFAPGQNASHPSQCSPTRTHLCFPSLSCRTYAARMSPSQDPSRRSSPYSAEWSVWPLASADAGLVADSMQSSLLLAYERPSCRSRGRNARHSRPALSIAEGHRAVRPVNRPPAGSPPVTGPPLPAKGAITRAGRSRSSGSVSAGRTALLGDVGAWSAAAGVEPSCC